MNRRNIMKINPGFALKDIAGSYVVVPVGDNLVDFSAMITLNETGAFLWNLLKEDVTLEELADEMCKEYEVSKEDALADAKAFTETLIEKKVLS